MNIMIASLFDFAISHFEMGFIALGIGLAFWGSVHKRRQRSLR